MNLNLKTQNNELNSRLDIIQITSRIPLVIIIQPHIIRQYKHMSNAMSLHRVQVFLYFVYFLLCRQFRGILLQVSFGEVVKFV